MGAIIGGITMPLVLTVDGCAPVNLDSEKQILPLTAKMDEAFKLATEVLFISYKINECMFGIGNPNQCDEASPKCYMDVMEMHLETLRRLYDELSSISVKIGV